uniref:G-protein coupled receptors family 1 profile domain-containing protein n=1 Tax=Timema shepardi TaxID=629360 RepID=A0A7R9B8D8_TIMSH|nr:unnamed protein product [Timema shepardi]
MKELSQFYDIENLEVEARTWYDFWKNKDYGEKVKLSDLLSDTAFFPSVKRTLLNYMTIPPTTCTVESHLSPKGTMEKKYTLIIENGSLHLIQDDPPSSALPSAFLVIVFTIGLCLNVFLVFSVCTCPSLRRQTFNLLLLQLCCACALECLINMTSSLTILMALDMGILESGVKEAVTFCRVNAMFSQGIALLEGVLVAAIAAERALLMKGIKVEQVGKPKFDAAVRWGLPLLVWVYPLILVLPIGVTSRMVGVRPFASRYSCGIVRCSTPVGQPQDLVYPSILGALGYIIPWAITVASICSMACHVSSVKRRQRQLEEASRQRHSQRNSTYLHSSSFGSTWSQVLGPANSSLPLWEEARCYLLLAAIIVTYLVLVVPHVFTISVPSSCPGMFVDHDLPPELTPIFTGAFDLICTWGRYHFTILTPILIFTIHKEIRKKCEHLFCCCFHGNIVNNIDESQPVTITSQSVPKVQNNINNSETGKKNECKRKIKKNKYKKEKYIRMAHYRTPVLFATSEGLHLRLVEGKFSENGLSESGRSFVNKALIAEPSFLCQFCDIGILTSTPIEIAARDTNYETSAKRHSNKQPPIFGEESVAEQDLRISESLNLEYEKSSNKVGLREEVFHNNVNRKVVRFAQAVNEIPLTESGVWSAAEDHT